MFLYLPHVFFVAEFGGEHFEASMHAQYELTQRFTVEYSIRVFLERYPEATLARCVSGHSIRAFMCAGSSPRELDRAFPGRLGCGRFKKHRGRCSNCLSCSRTIPNSSSAGRSPTT
jgi:hypothetical protein